jgi:putative transposase
VLQSPPTRTEIFQPAKAGFASSTAVLTADSSRTIDPPLNLGILKLSILERFAILKMPSNFTRIYIHHIWSTWDRQPMLIPEVRDGAYKVIREECKSLKCELIRIGGISDHVHLLATLNPTISLADFVKQVKGSSSHFINHEIRSGFLFKWQGSYGALTVSTSGVDDLCEYIDRQEEHHRRKSLIPDWELI